MALGKLVDRLGAPVANTAHASSGGTFLVRCGLLYRRGPGEADRLCIPAGSGLGTQVLRECHDGPLVGHFITARLEAISKQARWSDALPSGWARVRWYQTYQRTNAERCGPRGFLHHLPLPSRRGGMIGVDWIAGLPTTAAGFDMIQNRGSQRGRLRSFARTRPP